MSNVDHFDPSEMETEELVPSNETPESAYRPDTIGDPEGTEERAKEVAIVLPDFFYRRYKLDDAGNPTFNEVVVSQIMEVFDAKYGTEQSFSDDKAEKYFNKQVTQVVDGFSQLLEVDPQTTGINALQLATRTWAEFASVAYEYKDSISTIKEDQEIPDWLITREDKMVQLGRKARMLSAFLNKMDDKFGLKDTEISRFRVQQAVENRLQRLAEWNYNEHADKSGAVTSKSITNQTASAMFDNA
jgi:membrane-associated HD superfamily phosphohydrolase